VRDRTPARLEIIHHFNRLNSRVSFVNLEIFLPDHLKCLEFNRHIVSEGKYMIPLKPALIGFGAMALTLFLYVAFGFSRDITLNG